MHAGYVSGIMSTEDVSKEYMKETNMMFISGIIVAIAVEHSNLHKRIALNGMMIIGTSIRRCMNSYFASKQFTHFPLQIDAWLNAADDVPLHVDIEHCDDGDDGAHRRRRPSRSRVGLGR